MFDIRTMNISVTLSNITKLRDTMLSLNENEQYHELVHIISHIHILLEHYLESNGILIGWWVFLNESAVSMREYDL